MDIYNNYGHQIEGFKTQIIYRIAVKKIETIYVNHTTNFFHPTMMVGGS